MAVNLLIKKFKNVKTLEGDIKKVPNIINFKDGTTFVVKNNLEIKFKDSYLFLPAALRKLAHTFMVSLSKGYFPFKLYDIFYNGVIPAFESWTGTPIEEYDLIKRTYENRK